MIIEKKINRFLDCVPTYRDSARNDGRQNPGDRTQKATLSFRP